MPYKMKHDNGSIETLVVVNFIEYFVEHLNTVQCQLSERHITDTLIIRTTSQLIT